jgi:hypothetical protein
LFVIKKPKYGPVNNIAKKGFIWKIVNTGITIPAFEMKKGVKGTVKYRQVLNLSTWR